MNDKNLLNKLQTVISIKLKALEDYDQEDDSPIDFNYLSCLLKRDTLDIKERLPAKATTGEFGSDISVSFILLIIFSPTTTRLMFLTSSKDQTLFSSHAGAVGLTKKREKKNRKLAVTRLIKFLIESLKTAKLVSPYCKPIALHLRNVGSADLPYVVKSVKRYFPIISIKLFSSPPYNGCRKKKIRRKKGYNPFKH